METNGETANEMITRFRINWEDGQEIIQAHLMSDRAICFGLSDGRFIPRGLLTAWCAYVSHWLSLCPERYLGGSHILGIVSSAATAQEHSP